MCLPERPPIFAISATSLRPAVLVSDWVLECSSAWGVNKGLTAKSTAMLGPLAAAPLEAWHDRETLAI
jgi:hypothetical protein